jgi:hypothetical protein
MNRLPRQVVLTMLGIAAGTVPILARQTGMPAVRSVWAEDGWFLRDALTSTPLYQPTPAI